ncbi:FidL-like protein [Citrobacter amalonaticus]|uniref:FidL-like protein n=1 Tax=Citrobacter amalonaticus TaxID=35703 RepID=UPI00300D577F
MPKQALFLLICIGLMLAGAFYCFARTPAFSCESQFSVVQSINNDNIHAEGVIFVNMVDDNLLINIDGFLTHNDQKFLISRTLKLKYKAYNADEHLYKITNSKTTRDNTDNVDDKISDDLLFGKNLDGKIIFLKKFNNNAILFGNHAFPQYGCKQH